MSVLFAHIAKCCTIGFKTTGKDLEATDLQPADDLALLAAQCYVSAWELSQYDGQYLELAIGLLEFALRKSRYRYQMRILLISLYRVAGAPLMALKHYIMLDIKQVQLDTLGHWALDRGATFCAPEDMDKPAKSREEMSYSEITSRTAEWYPMADEEVSLESLEMARGRLSSLELGIDVVCGLWL